jgi:hypothetical protein
MRPARKIDIKLSQQGTSRSKKNVAVLDAKTSRDMYTFNFMNLSTLLLEHLYLGQSCHEMGPLSLDRVIL